MKKILVFRTSSDSTIFKLFEEIENNQVDCLIQTSQLHRYRDKYRNINFIDINGEGFYDFKSDILDNIASNIYDEIYITLSGTVGHNFGNIIEILQNLQFRKAYFYNCNGNRVSIPKKNVLKDFFCRDYIRIIQFLYRRQKKRKF